MKIRYLIGIVMIIFITIHFAAGGLIGSQSQSNAQNLVIEKAAPSGTSQNFMRSGEQFKQDESIFSKTTIISLVLAVMGIVAFRRNTYY